MTLSQEQWQLLLNLINAMIDEKLEEFRGRDSGQEYLYRAKVEEELKKVLVKPD